MLVSVQFELPILQALAAKCITPAIFYVWHYFACGIAFRAVDKLKPALVAWCTFCAPCIFLLDCCLIASLLAQSLAAQQHGSALAGGPDGSASARARAA